MHLSNLGTRLKIPSRQKPGSCVRKYTQRHFHFLNAVESATSQVLFQKPEQMEVRQDKVRVKGL
jgi:hypothetical protein